jgi:Protein of unknown function (DUF3047)
MDSRPSVLDTKAAVGRNRPDLRYAPIVLALLGLSSCSVSQFLPRPTNQLVSTGQPIVVAMDFATPFSLTPPPEGWLHVKFPTIKAMELDFVAKEGVPALRCETRDGGSILGRWTNIDLAAYPRLTWRWFVETPIASDIDERTTRGDDHPIRFYLEFKDTLGKPHSAEIIWGNKRLVRGDWKILEGIAHYVADGGDANIGQWRNEEADLVAIYQRTSGRNDIPRLTQLAIFCDSDNTNGHSIAYVGGQVTLGSNP